MKCLCCFLRFDNQGLILFFVKLLRPGDNEATLVSTHQALSTASVYLRLDLHMSFMASSKPGRKAKTVIIFDAFDDWTLQRS